MKETIGALEKAGIKVGHVRAVVITHAHDDHFGGGGALAKWSRAPIWAHVATATEIEDPWGGFARPGGAFPNTTPADWQRDRSLRAQTALGVFWRSRSTRRTRVDGTVYRCVVSTAQFDPRARTETEWCFGGHGNPLSSAARIQDELKSALGWQNQCWTSCAKSRPCPRSRSRGLSGAKFTSAGVKDAEAREPREPRQYSLVSVNAMLLDLTRRGLVKRNSDWEWELANPAAPSARQK